MGLIFSSVWERLFNYHKEVRLVMVGLDAAGKVKRSLSDFLFVGLFCFSCSYSSCLIVSFD
jgi:hypothetical protein